MLLYTCKEQGNGRKGVKEMDKKMSKADLIALLVSVREVARANGEMKTVLISMM